jgi:putative restriction endonuclease
MRAYIGITDRDWFDFLSKRPHLEEVNFWQPGGGRNFRAIQPGQPFLFKLHYPDNFIVGGGFLATFSRLPASLVWKTFGEMNGAGSYAQMRARVEKYRKAAPDPHEDYEIGNIILVDPFFLDREHWIPAPEDFAKNIVSGKGYDLTSTAGRALWDSITLARAASRRLPMVAAPEVSMFGAPALVRPRLRQGAFRVVITDNYDRRCAVTGEHTLPVLEAAHIKPVARGGTHDPRNGLLLRSDIHTLFDQGYVTITKEHRFRMSDRLKRDWQNGRIYYALHGEQVHSPASEESAPDPALLEWHTDEVFLG